MFTFLYCCKMQEKTMNSEPIDFIQKYKWKLQPQLMNVGVIPPSSDRFSSTLW